MSFFVPDLCRFDKNIRPLSMRTKICSQLFQSLVIKILKCSGSVRSEDSNWHIPYVCSDLERSTKSLSVLYLGIVCLFYVIWNCLLARIDLMNQQSTNLHLSTVWYLLLCEICTEGTDNSENKYIFSSSNFSFINYFECQLFGFEKFVLNVWMYWKYISLTFSMTCNEKYIHNWSINMNSTNLFIVLPIKPYIFII